MLVDSKLAVVFPGQGSQAVAMLDGWQQHLAAQAAIEQANSALGSELVQLIANGPKEDLALTVNTQPAMLLADVIAFRVWQAEVGLMPQYLAGHSLGEYAALVCAEVLSLSDALLLVRARAEAMQQAVPAGVGAMAAILGLPADQVEQLCRQLSRADAIVEAVNFNEPKQTVIAGHAAAVEQACTAAKELGARRALLLPVSGPFHSSLMQPAAEQFKAKLDATQFNPPKIAVINNVDVALETEVAAIKDALYRQVFGPVRWTQLIEKMAAVGVTKILEFGSGKALSGMNKRIVPDAVVAAVVDLTSLQQAKELLESTNQVML